MITLMSWGHKYGVPVANFKFDVSFLPNPWREEKMRKADHKTLTIYMEQQKGFKDLVNGFAQLIATYSKLYPGEEMVFAFACSAGEFRSVIMVESVKSSLEKLGIDCRINHPFSKI